MDATRTPTRLVSGAGAARRWPERFAQASGTLRRVLPEALLVEHVGSTAVPGLVAQDTVDVMVVVDDLGIVRERAPALAVAGFDLRLGAPVTRADRLFLRRVVDGHRTHHVHALLPSSPEVGDHLLLRDFLRAHPDEAAAYGEAKVRLAAEHGDDRTAYTRAKPALLEPLLVVARSWGVSVGR